VCGQKRQRTNRVENSARPLLGSRATKHWPVRTRSFLTNQFRAIFQPIWWMKNSVFRPCVPYRKAPGIPRNRFVRNDLIGLCYKTGFTQGFGDFVQRVGGPRSCLDHPCTMTSMILRSTAVRGVSAAPMMTQPGCSEPGGSQLTAMCAAERRADADVHNRIARQFCSCLSSSSMVS